MKGRVATFRFRINDLTPTATVTIKIYKHSKLKKTVTVGSKATNSAQSYKWKCKLARGSYTWKVCAKDLAGNTQTSIGHKTLVVK
jgi:Bacterial Ig-like domain